jgi:HTH-type transcriptional regulator/antitoxin HigA
MVGTTAERTPTREERVEDVIRPVSHLIQSEEDYKDAIARIDHLVSLNPREGSPEDGYLELLSVLVETYESAHETWSQERRSPQSLVRFMAEQKGISQGELAELMGGRSRLSDFLNGKRTLSRSQILELRDTLGIPADLLIA